MLYQNWNRTPVYFELAVSASYANLRKRLLSYIRRSNKYICILTTTYLRSSTYMRSDAQISLKTRNSNIYVNLTCIYLRCKADEVLITYETHKLLKSTLQVDLSVHFRIDLSPQMHQSQILGICGRVHLSSCPQVLCSLGLPRCLKIGIKNLSEHLESGFIIFF